MSSLRIINGSGLQIVVTADWPDPISVKATGPMELRLSWIFGPPPGGTYAFDRIYEIRIEQVSAQNPVTLRGALSGFSSFQVPLRDPAGATPAGVVVSADSGAGVPANSTTWLITAPITLKLGRTVDGWTLVP